MANFNSLIGLSKQQTETVGQLTTANPATASHRAITSEPKIESTTVMHGTNKSCKLQ